ncbi:hypothetical protein ABE137_08590 [Brevibacillus laterosporus]|uniref:Restriction alleviation protein, Lar family n=1 Tax=Brevibacillus halotolerans TaxID=1507437 RepID=A0ABT4HRA0_9BACL|nr:MULTISPECIES: hypothetical protein [Brevibacillus]MCR8983612.1 hypothetical protein [Brevibacillus laterosporus]MCZ0829330.1 hypothetical protein [Brevibacillus halotolerans]GIO00662.1 hypothetical protein J5TS2_13300 [Brevibacillus halotolerans]
MWECPYCGFANGHVFLDNQLHGILCLNPDCGRFDSSDTSVEMLSDWDTSDF